MKKDIGVIIKFDNVEYSDKERDLLWGRLALFLAEAAEELKENKNAKCFNFPNNEHQSSTKNLGISAT